MTIKSQDDLNETDQHSTDVLIAALEKCEKLELQVEALKDDLSLAIEALEVAEDALTDIWINDGVDLPKARLQIERTLERIK